MTVCRQAGSVKLTVLFVAEKWLKLISLIINQPNRVMNVGQMLFLHAYKFYKYVYVRYSSRVSNLYVNSELMTSRKVRRLGHFQN